MRTPKRTAKQVMLTLKSLTNHLVLFSMTKKMKKEIKKTKFLEKLLKSLFNLIPL